MKMNKILILLLISFNALADPIQWVAPTEYENNTPILPGELAGFKIYYGASSGVHPINVVIPDPAATSYDLDLVYGDNYAVVTAYDIHGRESKDSTEVFKNIPRPLPKQVTGVSWADSP